MQRRIVTLLALTTLLLGLIAAPAQAATPARSQQDNAKAIADLVDRHNAARRSSGLAPLKFAPKVSEQISQPWTMKMANSNNLSHNSSFGWAGANRWAENVAYSSAEADTAQLMKMWMESPGHRTNLMNPNYTVIAVGVVRQGGLTWATANFYGGSLRDAGALYSSGAAWLAGSGPGKPTPPNQSVDVYTTPGTHHVNGRDWSTTCEPYSQTKRCTTNIWATQVSHTGGRYVSTTGWVFNNMTYLPSPRKLWSKNNLGKNANWSANGRRWRTECDTAATGRNGCRSYIWSSAVVATKTSGGYRYSLKDQWVFNNIVQFS